MIHPRLSLLGALVSAIGLMAVFATSGQAETRWLVLKLSSSGLYSDSELEASNGRFVGTLENNTGKLLTEIGKMGFTITCTAGSPVDALLAKSGGTKEGAIIRFTGCSSSQTKCTPKTNGGPSGTIETLSLHNLLKLHTLVVEEGGKKVELKVTTVLITPDNAKELLTNIELGATCVFGEELPIFGLLSVQDCGGTKKALEHLQVHLITEFEPLTDLAVYAKRSEGGTPVKLDGSMNISVPINESLGALYAGDAS